MWMLVGAVSAVAAAFASLLSIAVLIRPRYRRGARVAGDREESLSAFERRFGGYPRVLRATFGVGAQHLPADSP
jgi:hypothetical protein